MTLTDDQQMAILRATAPLEQHQRSAFMATLYSLLAGRHSIGDGELYRFLRELQRQYFSPPIINEHQPSHELKMRRSQSVELPLPPT